MKLLTIFGLCFAFAAVAYAGDADNRDCDPCDAIDATIAPTPVIQIVTGSTVGTANSDYAYAFCAVAGGQYLFSLCPEFGGWADFDTELSVQGPQNCGPYIVCNDDYCGLQSQLDFVAPADDTYIVVVDGYYTYVGNFGLAYMGPSAPSPANNTAWGEIKAMFR